MHTEYDPRTKRNELYLKQQAVNLEIARKSIEIEELRYQILECDIAIANAQLAAEHAKSRI